MHLQYNLQAYYGCILECSYIEFVKVHIPPVSTKSYHVIRHNYIHHNFNKAQQDSIFYKISLMY